MANVNIYLITGGVVSALISIFHVFLTFKPALFTYIAPAQSSTITQLAEQGSSLTTIASIVLAVLFAIWAIYAFSGAGLIPRLPLLRTGIIVITIIYLLRGLFLLTEINMVLKQGYPWRFVAFSSIALITGLLYLVGLIKQRLI